jgi:signal peptidase I
MTRKVPGIISAAVLLTLAGGVFWAARSVRTALVPSASMEPELKVGDLLLIRKDAYRHDRSPARGDVVLFQHDDVPDYFVKRVIGLPGEDVLVISGRVTINGQYLLEPYATQATIREWPTLVTLAEDEYFLMGDNRAHSEDSRDIGPVRLQNIKGMVASIIAPRARRGRIVNPFEGLGASHTVTGPSVVHRRLWEKRLS